MTAILTLAQLREHLETDLTDPAVQRIIDADDAEIIRRLGAVATQAEVRKGGEQYLTLARAAASITSIVERYAIAGTGYQDITLATNDYNLLADGYKIERLFTGTNPNAVFLGIVTVNYVPKDTLAERIALLVRLVTLDITFDGRAAQSIGDVRIQNLADHQAARAALFGALATGGRRLLF